VDVTRRHIVIGGALALAGRALVVAAAPPRAVAIDAFAFKPASLTVQRGETVRWTNGDPVPHTVTAAGAFESGSIAAGGGWSYTVAKAGRYDYVCAFHPMMRGTLIVV